MKTGRRRKKAPSPEPPEQAPPPEPGAVTPPSAAQPRAQVKEPTAVRQPRQAPVRVGKPWLFVLIALVVFICLGALIIRACLGPRSAPVTYLPATAEGSWATEVRLVVPQVGIEDRWRSDCEADAQCTVIPGTCELRERADKYTERQVDDYDEYAYNIYYEETEAKLYEAATDDFVVTQLNENRDWWEGDLHYYAEEWLDGETCQYTNYTVWITDPEDTDYEIEVILSECEVWDHVVVKERVEEQEEYCQTENLGAVTVQDTLTHQGVGAAVEWPGAVPPSGGELEHEFEGTVTFRADGTTHTVRVTDADEYIRYLTTPYYLGVDDDGDVVDLTDSAP